MQPETKCHKCGNILITNNTHTFCFVCHHRWARDIHRQLEKRISDQDELIKQLNQEADRDKFNSWIQLIPYLACAAIAVASLILLIS